MPTETHAPTRQKYANDLDTMALTNSNFHFSMRDWHGHLHLCSAAQKVFEKLCLRARLKYGAWTTIPGYDLIVEDTRLSERRVQDMVKLLEKEGLILVEHRTDKLGGDLANRFTLPAEKMWAEARKNFLARKALTAAKRKAKAEKLAAFRGVQDALLANVDDIDAVPNERDRDQADLDLIFPGSSAVAVAEPEDVTAFAAAAAEDAKELARRAAEVKAAEVKAAEVINLLTCGTNTLADGTQASKRAYWLAASVYCYSGQTTATRAALDCAAAAIMPLLLKDGVDINQAEYDFIVQSMRWAILQSSYWAPLIKASAKCYDRCPVRFLMGNWEDAGEKHRIKHQATDHAKEFLPLPEAAPTTAKPKKVKNVTAKAKPETFMRRAIET